MATKRDSKKDAPDASAAPVYKWPKTLGGMADRLYTLRAARLLTEGQAQRMKDEETALKEHLIKQFTKSEINGAKGKLGATSITPKLIPTPENWDVFFAYVKRTGNFHMMQKRLNEAAIKEVWDLKKKVPGIGVFETVTVHVTKA